MRKRFLGVATVVAAVTSVVLGVSPASASAGWTVTPGGAATGTAGETVLTVRPIAGGDDMIMTCSSSVAEINAFSSPDSHVADITSIAFNQCLLGGLISFEVDAHTPWPLHALSYSAPVVSGEIRDISATIIGAGCLAEVAGTVNGSYDNTADTLTVANDFTLTVTNVDPVDNCLGLINTGDAAAFTGVYAVDPGQDIVPA